MPYNLMDKLAPILWKHWEKPTEKLGTIQELKPNEKPNSDDDELKKVIVGYWAEDNTKYYLDVPPQLRDIIIQMQNWLCDKYKLVEDYEQTAKAIRTFFDSN